MKDLTITWLMVGEGESRYLLYTDTPKGLAWLQAYLGAEAKDFNPLAAWHIPPDRLDVLTRAKMDGLEVEHPWADRDEDFCDQHPNVKVRSRGPLGHPDLIEACSACEEEGQ